MSFSETPSGRMTIRKNDDRKLIQKMKNKMARENKLIERPFCCLCIKVMEAFDLIAKHHKN